MSERMHLRAKLAMEFYKLTVLANPEDDRSRDACIAWAIPAADALLAELQKGEPLAQEPETEECGCVHPNDALVRAFQRRTDRAEARMVAQDGIIEARSKSLDDAEARVRDLTAQVAALNHLDEEAADEAREWKARAERAESTLNAQRNAPRLLISCGDGDVAQVLDSMYTRKIRDRLAAIDAAKTGETPMPPLSYLRSAANMVPGADVQFLALCDHAQQGWDTAAALRVELAMAKEIHKANFGVVLNSAEENEERSREEGRKEERERCVKVLSEWSLHVGMDSRHGTQLVRVRESDLQEWLGLLELPTKEEK